jgi:hypothetical protein
MTIDGYSPASGRRCSGPSTSSLSPAAGGWPDVQIADPVAAPGDLAGRGLDLLDIALGLAEMGGKLGDTIIQPADIVHQPRHLILNKVRLLAQPRIAQHRLHHLNGEREQRG